MIRFSSFVFGVGIFFAGIFCFAPSAAAYSTNMSASVVIGQADFTNNSANQGGSVGANTLGTRVRSILVDAMGRLIVSDSTNHRILIWNSIPVSNNVPADIVLGQPNFTSSTANNGGRQASTLSTPSQIATDGTRFFVADANNNRILIWNTLPTRNQQPADVVVGQVDMASAATACNSSGLNGPHGVTVYKNRLVISIGGNSSTPNRILIYNSIPVTNGRSADLVLGQVDFTTCGLSAVSSTSFKVPYHMFVDENGKLYLADNTRSSL